MFVSHGDILYSFTGEDCVQLNSIILLTVIMVECPILSDHFPDCHDMALDFFRTQWRENKDHESVFMMEGLSEAAAHRLMMLARGRYSLAWQYWRNFPGRSREFLECGILFSEIQDRDDVARTLCREQQAKEQMIWLSKFVAASWAVGLGSPAVPCLMSGQDVREFFQRNPQLLNQ
jgi:hypothetical protein